MTSLAVLVVSLALAIAVVAPDRRTAQLFYSVGVLLIFGGSTLLPINPTNATARLAIDSADPTSVATVAVLAGIAVVAYGGLRVLVGRLDPAAIG